MFGRKSKNKGPVSQNREMEARLGDKVLFRGNLEDLPIKDEWVIKKSVEFFNDPEPCFIHRSAVTIRLLNEIWESAAEGVVSEYVDYPPGAVIIRKNGADEAAP